MIKIVTLHTWGFGFVAQGLNKWIFAICQQEALDGYRQCMIEMNSDPEEVRKRAMADPEIQNILKDPAMRLILEQIQNDPKALSE